MRCRKYFPLAYHLENLKVMLSTVGEGMWERGPGLSESCVRKSCLDNSEKRCNMTLRDPKPPDFSPSGNRKLTSRRRPTMNAKILTFASDGDKTLLEYDPAPADMEEENERIAGYDAQPGAKPLATRTA